MKKALIILLLPFAGNKILSASTGERSDDFLVVLVPLAFLTIVWAGYEVKKKIKARKEATGKATSEPDNVEESSKE